jgi:hypothetical protein
LGNTTE